MNGAASGRIDRRVFLARAGVLGAALAFGVRPWATPAATGARPDPEQAALLLRELSRDTLAGLASFVVPGPDAYSVAQGVWTPEDGALAARTPDFLMTSLDNFFPVPDQVLRPAVQALATGLAEVPLPLPPGFLGVPVASVARLDDALSAHVAGDGSVPLSLLISLMLNQLATFADPASLSGRFPSPFANLSYEGKAEAFRLLEEDDARLAALLDAGAPEPMRQSYSGLLRFTAGALLEFAGFGAYGEWAVLDGHTLTGVPGLAPHRGLRRDRLHRGGGMGRLQGLLPEPQEREVMARDVIVFGAGGGGPVVAKELAARGLDVLLLEAGPHFDDPEKQLSHYENDANNPLTGILRFGPGDRTKPAWFRETPQNSFLWQLAGVGGTTLHYFANSPRAVPGAFAGYEGPDAGAYDTEHRFPFRYAELVPYYQWVEATLPVQTAAMGAKEEVFFRGAESMGLPVGTSKDVTRDHFRPQENAILQPGGTAGRVTATAEGREALAYGKAWGCTHCGACLQGCMHPVSAPVNLVAKRSTNVSYVPMALTADRWSAGGRPVTLIPDAFATRVVTVEEAGETVARAVTWRDTRTGEFHTEEARVVVLAGGCTETPRLWLNSGLPNPNGWVGRGYTDHFFDWVTGVFPFETGTMKGAASAARVDYPGLGGLENVGLPPALQAFSLLFSDSGIRGAYANGRGPAGPWDGAAGRLVGPELKDVLAHLDRLLNVLVITDDDVEAQNRVTLSGMSADEHGPVAKVEFHARNRSPRTLRNREALARRAADLLWAAGASRVYRIDWPPLILHVQSTMRMGHSEADSVLDDSAEARWVLRLFVADNSALANSLGGPNPTLTSQALATRTAERIFRRHFGGDPWVGTEAPVPSFSHKVTQGLAAVGR